MPCSGKSNIQSYYSFLSLSALMFASFSAYELIMYSYITIPMYFCMSLYSSTYCTSHLTSKNRHFTLVRIVLNSFKKVEYLAPSSSVCKVGVP